MRLKPPLSKQQRGKQVGHKLGLKHSCFCTCCEWDWEKESRLIGAARASCDSRKQQRVREKVARRASLYDRSNCNFEQGCYGGSRCLLRRKGTTRHAAPTALVSHLLTDSAAKGGEMSKSKIGKCRRKGDPSIEQPWFLARRKRNRVRDRIAKASRKINRSQS